ncbi:MAG: hypothetical protein EBR34_05800 [Sphingomonadaceae bacterium]|nr:hypothetical protein [Sphingomonadaceae bacterium]
MIARAGSGWQTVLADLSLILFMVTAAAVAEAPPTPPPAAAMLRLPALGDPVAVWRAAPGGPKLAEWLAGQPSDLRQRLTLVASPADASRVLAEAAALPRPARVLIEPGLTGPPYAALTYDTGDNP